MPADIQQLRSNDWRNEFAAGDFRRGQDDAAAGRSQLERLHDNRLQASCLDSAGQRYQQRITLSPYGRQWRVNGRCTCPVAHNCRHVAAALLTLEQLQRSGADLSAIRSSPPSAQSRADIAPQPILSLGSLSRVHFDARKGRMLEQTQHRAALAFSYAGKRVHGKQPDSVRLRDDQGLWVIQRQAAAEARCRQQLLDAGLQLALRRSDALPESAGEAFELPSDAAWIDFVSQQLPVLAEQGWQIEPRNDFQFNLAAVDRWYAQVNESPAQDWFELELGIEIDGQPHSLLPILLQAIRRSPWLLNPQAMALRDDDEVFLAQLPGQSRRIAIPFARLRPLLASLGELYQDSPDDWPSCLRLARADAPRLLPLSQAAGLHWQDGEQLRELAQRLQHSPQAREPEGLQAQLRPYQREGLAWLQTLGELGLGGILADDMGLGKTLQTLAYLLGEQQAGRLQQPALLVMPTSLVANWQDEAARFTPSLRVLALQGSQRQRHFATLADYQVILTTYALLPRDCPALARQAFSVVICDEAQYLKNPRNKAYQALSQLTCRQRLCLTGTPLENHLGELWALFNLLMPGWLGDSRQFTRHYRQPIESQPDSPRLTQLRQRIRPFLLRRRKEDVARELPAKTEITHWVSLSPAQRDRYETLRLALDHKVRAEIQRQGLARSQIVILEALLRLRQCCCDLRLLDGPTSSGEPSAKLTALLDMLDELLAEGRRVLVFSQFTGMLALIEQALQARGIRYGLLTGGTTDRRTPVAQFQAGAFPVFLISLKAGGTGLNLTAADTVIHFDPWWNPAAEAQASDRAYRIGQDKPVFVYRLISRGSVEEKIQQLQQRKAQLAHSLLDQNQASGWQLDEQALAELFAPLH